MKKSFLYLLTILIIFFIKSETLAQTELAGYAAPFLRMELGARGLALGGALVSSDPDGVSFYYNPAALPFLEKKTILISYRTLSLDRYFRAVSYSQFVKPTAGISFAWISSGVGEITGRDFTGSRTGNIDYSENAFCFSFGIKPAENFSFGISGKVLRSKIYTISANSFALDFGIFIRPKENINIGIQVKDFNGKYAWDSSDIYERGTKTYDKIPKSFNAGINYKVKSCSLNIYMAVSAYSTTGKVYRFGIEKKVLQFLTLRSGIFNKSYAGGIGLKLKMFKKGGFIDYTYVSIYEDPLINHIITLTINM